LLKELKKSPRLFGVWTVMPHHTGEMAPPGDVIKEMRDNGIRAAKMYPRTHRYFFNEDTCGDLFSELEEEGIPLLLEGGMMYGPDILEPLNQVLLSELDAVLSRHPRLRVLLQNAKWESTRFLHTLMSKHQNLYLELSNHQGNRALEVFTGWFGAGRLLFGTGALDKSPGAAKAFVDYSTLGEDEKSLIAGRNLARLLRMDSLPAPYKPVRSKDPILAAAKAGQPARDLLVIDSHAHIGHDGGSGMGFLHLPFSDAPSMVERAKLTNTRQVCVSSFVGIWADYDEGNEIVRRAVQAYPKFYVGYATLQPQYVKDWQREIRRVHGRDKMPGLKPYHPRTNIPYDDKAWAPWFEFGNRHRCFTLLHPSPNFVAEATALAARYPDMTWILAHTGGSYPTARQGIEVALKFPNVYLEITLTTVTLGVIEFMVEHVGADRVLYGSDQPMRDPLPQYGWLAYSRCTPDEKKQMFGVNMRRVLRRVRL
jgi:predicted TIM-barrel fold metal-dependent hydrolase